MLQREILQMTGLYKGLSTPLLSDTNVVLDFILLVSVHSVEFISKLEARRIRMVSVASYCRLLILVSMLEETVKVGEYL